ARAIGADPLPKKPLEAEYSRRNSNLRRVEIGVVEATHRIGWDGEYIVRFGLPGARGADAKTVTMSLWMDVTLLYSIPVETKPSKLVYFNPYSEEEMRLTLPEGDHTFRAAFVNDDFVKGMTEGDAYADRKNKFIGSMIFIGPFPSK